MTCAYVIPVHRDQTTIRGYGPGPGRSPSFSPHLVHKGQDIGFGARQRHCVGQFTRTGRRLLDEQQGRKAALGQVRKPACNARVRALEGLDIDVLEQRRRFEGRTVQRGLLSGREHHGWVINRQGPNMAGEYRNRNRDRPGWDWRRGGGHNPRECDAGGGVGDGRRTRRGDGIGAGRVNDRGRGLRRRGRGKAKNRQDQTSAEQRITPLTR